MLTKFFLNIKLGIALWLIGFAIIIWGVKLSIQNQCFTINWALYNGVTIAVGAALILISALLIYNIFDINFNITRRNYYAPLIFVSLITWVPNFLSWQIGAVLVLTSLVYYNFYKIYLEPEEKHVSYYLNIGALSFLVSFISPIGLFILVLSFGQSLIFGRFNWRKFILPIYGFALFFISGLAIAFLLDNSQAYIKYFNYQFNFIALSDIKNNSILVVGIVSLFTFSLMEYLRALSKASVLKRKILSLLFLHFLIAVAAVVVFNFQIEIVAFLLFATSVLFANYLQYIKKFALRETWLWLVIALGVALPFLSKISIL